jgi:hypothetical protein
MTALETLVNVGPQLATDLRFVGNDSAETLTGVGADAAAQRLATARMHGARFRELSRAPAGRASPRA